MVKFEVKPFASIKGTEKDDVRTGVEARFEHNAMQLKVRADDSPLRGDGGWNGVVLTARRANRFEFVYDVGSNGPALTFHTHQQIGDKNVCFKYEHAVKGKTSRLDAKVPLDEKNSATVGMNLHGMDAPDLKQLSLKWHYQHDDNWCLEPSYDFGNEAFSAKLSHHLDVDNDLSATYDAHANTAALEWKNRSLGGGGELRVTATANLADDGLKQMPHFTAQKVFDVEL